SRIPNGDSVLDPCDNTAWPGVGHISKSGGGSLNPFGSDFRDAGYRWTVDLCQKDSDGDGISNGAELGDSACAWTPSNGATLGPVIGHPGVGSCAVSNVQPEDQHGHSGEHPGQHGPHGHVGK
ncbi:hypothetical protein BaRGS_00017207, partial [Batillaria attramentaria]